MKTAWRKHSTEVSVLVVAIIVVLGLGGIAFATAQHQAWIRGDLASLSDGRYRVMIHQTARDGREDYDLMPVIDDGKLGPDHKVTSGIKLPHDFVVRDHLVLLPLEEAN